MDNRLTAPWFALRCGIGLTATVAGLDKFFNLLADWDAYISPLAAQVLPFATDTFMAIVGVIELAVGVAILAGWTRIGSFVASAWLAGVAINLSLAGFFDVATRDLVIAIAAFTLARLEEVRQQTPSYQQTSARPHRVITA